MRRNTYLGASQFSAAIGISPYTSRAEQWRLMTGRKVFDGNEATRHGNDCEGLAVAAYEAHTGEIVTDRQRWYSEDYLGTHIDGQTPTWLTEFKCPFGAIYDGVPEHYMPQLQGQMYLSGIMRVHFVAWTQDELRIWEVNYDKRYLEWMLPMLRDFWRLVEIDSEPKRLNRKPVAPLIAAARIA